MFASKLKVGDEIRVIAPSRSFDILKDEQINTAIKNLEYMGFRITFSKNHKECDEFFSSSIKSRVSDLHEAFLDRNVKGILTAIGGFNCNQLLKYIDYDIIKSNPKIICGYSDITALSNAIYKKTGIVTYSGAHFSTFGMKKGLEYTIEYFKKCLLEETPYEVKASEKWSNDMWWESEENRNFYNNEGYKAINEGEARGTIVGGNLCTFNLLQGTEFMPNLEDKILFIEDDYMTIPEIFDRDLQSLIHQPGFYKIKGIVIGRFEIATNMTYKKLYKIIKTKKELDNIPVISGADFGHTTPCFTFPIGGNARIIAEDNKVKIEIEQH